MDIKILEITHGLTRSESQAFDSLSPTD